MKTRLLIIILSSLGLISIFLIMTSGILVSPGDNDCYVINEDGTKEKCRIIAGWWQELYPSLDLQNCDEICKIDDQSELDSKNEMTSSIPLRGLPVIDNSEIQSMIDLFENRYDTSQRTFVGPYVILNATNVWGETVSLVMQSMDGKVNATLTCNHMDWRNQEVITENVLDYLQNKNCFNPALEETRK